MIRRKRNIAGYTDERGVFRPIRKPSYVGTAKRKATTKDRKKYSRAKAGDLGKAKQERALEDVFQREIRLQREDREHKTRVMKQIERETLGDATETTKGRTLVEFVRGQGGIKPGYKFAGKKNRGKRVSYDAGELAPLTYKESGKRGLVSDKGMRSLDGMFQAAREAGYDVADMDDLIGRMEKEIRGDNATYATRGYIDYRDNPKSKKKNPINIFGVVAAVSGVQSALQINEMLKKKPVKRKASVRQITNGTATAKRKNPVGNSSGAKFNEQSFDRDLAQIEDGNFRAVRSAKLHGKLAGYRATEIEQMIQRARLAYRLKEMYRAKENPAVIAAELRLLQAATKLLGSRRKNGGRSIKRNPVGWFRDASPVTPEAIKKLYRTLAAKYHPDKGGDTRTMQEINADYDKAMKIAISGEGNESRAKAETQAIKPLREAIEFAVTLPDDVKVVIRGLWLWIEGNTYKAKDQIKSFKASDGKRFKWASQKKAWFFAAVPSSNRRGEMSFDAIEALHGRRDVKERKTRRALNPVKVKLYKFFKGQKLATRFIGDHDLILRGTVLSRTPKFVTIKVEGYREPVRCGVRVWENTEVIYPTGRYSMAPSFRAKDGDRIGNPRQKAIRVGDTVRFREVLEDGDDVERMEVLEDRGNRVLVKSLVFALDGMIQPTSVYSKDELVVIKNPAAGSATTNPKRKKVRYVVTWEHGEQTFLNRKDAELFAKLLRRKGRTVTMSERPWAKSNPERCLKCRKETSEGTWDINGGFCNPCAAKMRPKAKAFKVVGGTGRTVATFAMRKQATAYGKLHPAYSVKAMRAKPAKSNPVKPPRSHTFESFNGRPVTNATRRPVSAHAPAKLAQLGDLIEIKLVGGQILTPNPSRYKLTAANGKLWIAGGKFAKANPAAKANEINPLGLIDHVVYRTHKPHHGDAPNTHYIHKLGEETGHRPLLCVDREGFPVIRGGKYKIEARGIVN
ncbi:MAG: hypothetical protein PSX80_00500 [bacterium]|nr:hypothetical protein [bacterium]